MTQSVVNTSRRVDIFQYQSDCHSADTVWTGRIYSCPPAVFGVMADVCSDVSFEQSLRPRILLLPHLLTVITVLVVVLPMSTQDQCAADHPRCYCDKDSVICRGLGDVSQVPSFFQLEKTYDSFSIDVFQGHSRISKVQTNAFVDLKVKHINLGRLGITTVEPGAFTGLEDVLEKLYLNSNWITTIASYTFNGLMHLTYLDISYNRISVLNHTAFSHLPKLVTISLSSNHLGIIADNATAGLYNVRKLDVSHNYTETLNPHVFYNMSDLKELNLKANRLRTIPIDAFNSISKSLTRLQLESNKLAPITAGVFTNMLKLEYLHLGWNLMSNMASSSFINMSKLETLYLNHNFLRDYPGDGFREVNPKILSLSENNLTTLNHTHFKDFTKLEWLSLSSNQLGSISKGYFRWTHPTKGITYEQQPH